MMAYECAGPAETPCSSGGEQSLAGVPGVRLDREAADLAGDCIMSASAVKVGFVSIIITFLRTR